MFRRAVPGSAILVGTQSMARRDMAAEHLAAPPTFEVKPRSPGERIAGSALRDWLKPKCHTTGVFVITGFPELGFGRLEALHVEEETEDGLLRGDDKCSARIPA